MEKKEYENEYYKNYNEKHDEKYNDNYEKYDEELKNESESYEELKNESESYEELKNENGSYEELRNESNKKLRNNSNEKIKSENRRASVGKHLLYGIIILILICGVALVSGVIGGYVASERVESNMSHSVIFESTSVPVIESGSIPEIVFNTQNSVVQIGTESIVTSPFMRQYVSTGAGSGVIVTNTGYIVTNDHVISGARNIEVTLKNGTRYAAVVINSDPVSDIAVLKIYPDENDLEPAVFGDSDKIVIGEGVIAIGNPLGEGGTVTNGIVSALEKQITINGTDMTLIQTNAAINPGNSGGALFNMRGELIGIVNAKTAGTVIEGIGFAIPSNTVKEIVDDLINVGYVTGRVNLGIEVIEISDFRDMFYYGVSTEGFYITNVKRNSDAEKAGLRIGDRIVEIDGKEIYSASNIASAVSKKSPKDKMSIIVERRGEQKQITVEFTEHVPI